MAIEGYWRRVYVGMWRRGSFSRLSRMPPSGQGLWLYLLTCPESSQLPGAINMGRGALADALRWAPEQVASCWQEIEDEGMAQADWDACLIWLPNAVEANLPQSPSVAKGWGEKWRALPDCGLKGRILEDVERALEGGPKGSVDAFRVGCGQVLAGDQKPATDDTGAPLRWGREAPELEPGVVVWLRCKRGAWTAVTEERVRDLQQKYPHVDVRRELLRERGIADWLVAAAPRDVKEVGKRHVWAYVRNWLARAEDRVRNWKNPPVFTEAPRQETGEAGAVSPYSEDHRRYGARPAWRRYENYVRDALGQGVIALRYEEWEAQNAEG